MDKKRDLFQAINRALAAAELPPLPVELVYRMTVRDLDTFNTTWIAPVCGKIVAARSDRERARVIMAEAAKNGQALAGDS